MGVVVHDSNPELHSRPDWLKNPLFDGECNLHHPIFILFKEVESGVEYEPYEPGIKAMISSIFNRGWAFDPRVATLRSQLGMYMACSVSPQMAHSLA
jgi:hypothetical protein